MGIMDLFDRYGRSYKKGEIVFNENEQGKDMFLILKGKIRIYKTFFEVDDKTENTKEIVREVAIMEKPEFFGEMSLLNNEPRVASAMAYEDTELLVIDETTFQNMVRANGKFAIKVISKLTERIREAGKKLDELTAHNKQKIIIKYLLELRDKFNNIIPKSFVFSFSNAHYKINKEDIQVILNKLLKSEIITINDNSIEIIDIDTLNQLIAFFDF